CARDNIRTGYYAISLFGLDSW
nr:immunoglobulin heavy chain junction region [Macaca mulatta]MOV42785.1 immunoglobulin heavy chain junction region [Macaca mulatta]MOV42794.1 immunoglobulin heavy chain junction region [Macaca mulatta]MOV44658.1 immunoglobulin heavy chain junction region [Macaca mulatta]